MIIVVEKGVLKEVNVDYEKDIGVKEFAIPDGVAILADESLAHLPLEVEMLYIPKSVKKIHEGAFFGEGSNWENLKNIIVEEGNKNYKSQTGCLIDINSNTVILGTENAIIPNGIEKIGVYAFRQRAGLTEITIPESVKEVDLQAFACCNNLKKVTVLGEKTNLDYLCFILDTAIEEFNLPEKADYEFIDGCLVKKSCETLLMLTEKGEIPKNIVTIWTWACARYCKDVVVPETVVSFAENAFLLLGGGKLKVKKDSPAHKYAVENELNYEIIR
ncbi:MAG: leucine-rich repeat protein [Clostridia bacterium]|nr:leucine-rich repeat protein [Clostridia bacterium]